VRVPARARAWGFMPLVCARANISVMRALSSKACLSLSIALCATAAAALLGAFVYAETACRGPGLVSARKRSQSAHTRTQALADTLCMPGTPHNAAARKHTCTHANTHASIQ
jgi:hypothetical protein